MAEAYLLQKEYSKAEKVINNAEKVFPGEKLLFEKKVWIRNQAQKIEQKEKQKYKKMFAKK